MPCTHCETWPWFSQTWSLKPTCAAIFVIESLIVFRKGIALDAGMLMIDLSAMHGLASNGSPAAWNSGSFLYGSSAAADFVATSLAACAAEPASTTAADNATFNIIRFIVLNPHLARPGLL